MSKYLQNVSFEISTQNQTIKNNESTNDEAQKLNYDYENFDIEKSVQLKKTFFINSLLSFSVTKRKNKKKFVRTRRDRKMTIDVAANDTKTYRCTIRDNTKNLIRKFSFVIEKDFIKFMKKNQDELFKTMKYLLSIYQTMNDAFQTLKQKLTITKTNNNMLEKRVETQKQKIANFFKKRQKSIKQIIESKSFIRFKKKKVIKFRKSKNAHRKNFETMNVRNKSLLIDKQIMKKMIENLKRRLRNAKAYVSSINSNRENVELRHSSSNKRTEKQNYENILRREQSLSNMRFESSTRRETERYVEKMFVSKHKYSELSLFYDDATKWKTWKTHLMTKMQIDFYDFFVKWNKINYAKDKTRDNVQFTIWHKAKSNFIESYKKFRKLIEDLINVFEKKKQDKHKTLLQQLFFSSFAMNVKNRFEIFEKFLARFTSTMSSLRLSNNDKIMHLYRNFFDQFTKKIYHLNELIEYAKYVKEMRQMTNQMKIRNDIKQVISSSIVEEKKRSSREVEIIRKDSNVKKLIENKSKTKAQNMIKNMLSRFFAHIRNKFKKNDRCFKCEKKNI